MSGRAQIDFWFSMGSTYTYLTVMRLAEVEKVAGVEFRWRPFDLLAILKHMKHIPFADKPAKAAYMWRDIERRAALYGIPIRVPAPYPLKQSIVANRVAVVGLRESWGKNFIRAAYRRWFMMGQETGCEPNVSESLRDIGEDPVQILHIASGDEIGRLIAAETEVARGLGIFGSPTFAVDGELFWGDDRLEDAIRWRKHQRLSAA